MASSGPPRPPSLKLECFPVKLAIWEVPGRNGQSGKEFKTYTIKLTKVYKDNNGQWNEIQTLSSKDLLIAAGLLTEAWRRLECKEVEVVAKSDSEVGGPPPAEDPKPF